MSTIGQVDGDGCGLTGCRWRRDIGDLLTPLELTHLDRDHTDGLLLVGDGLGLADSVWSGGLGGAVGLSGHPGLGQVLGVDGDHHLLATRTLRNTEAFEQVVIRRYNIV